MSIVLPGKHSLTLINTFTVDRVNQERLIQLLTLATENTISKRTGFIWSSLHRSLDGSKVTMYAQWRNVDDYEAMRNDAEAAHCLDEALSFASFEPGLYELVQTFATNTP